MLGTLELANGFQNAYRNGQPPYLATLSTPTKG